MMLVVGVCIRGIAVMRAIPHLPAALARLPERMPGDECLT
jgi:hypothetical protein